MRLRATGVILLSEIIAMAGCTQVDRKLDAYRDASGRFLHPDKLRICYTREGDKQQGIESRCFGDGCTLPECPQ